MALPAYFFIRGFEIGGTQAGRLQYRDNSNTWQNLGDWAAVETTIIINSEINPIPVDYNLFEEGETYYFRFIDMQGHPISNVVEFTFPFDFPPLLNLDGTPIENLDGSQLLNI